MIGPRFPQGKRSPREAGLNRKNEIRGNQKQLRRPLHPGVPGTQAGGVGPTNIGVLLGDREAKLQLILPSTVIASARGAPLIFRLLLPPKKQISPVTVTLPGTLP